MDTRNIPILLTSSVIPHDKGVRLQDPHERERLALESIKRWCDIAPSNPLVLCDGSGFDFAPLVRAMPDGKKIECLHFHNDAAVVQQHGRGYGEGEIVRFAVKHSASIQAVGGFAKCTSKLWVENFYNCMTQWNGKILLKGVFDDVFSLTRATRFSYIDTRFYAMDVATYQASFICAHEGIRATQGHGLEECFRDVFLGLACPPCLTKVPPVICGMGGGTGTYYKNTPVRRAKERLRFQIVSHDPAFKSWFS